jgi:putative transcriptional regulator
MRRTNKIIAGLNEAVLHARGVGVPGARVHTVKVPAEIDVAAIRAKLGLSQRAFAERFNFSISTLQQWEQKRRVPEGPARTLLTLIDRAPGKIQKLLSAA